MAGEEELILRAVLDHQQVLEALDEIQRRSASLEKNSNENIRRIGFGLGQMAKRWRDQANIAQTVEVNWIRMFGHGTGGLANLRKRVESFNRDSKKLATVFDAFGEAGGLVKAENEFRRFNEIVLQLRKSSDESAKQIGDDFADLGSEIARAYARGELSAEEAAGTIRELGTIAQASGKQLIEEFGKVDISRTFRFEEAQAKFDNLRQTAARLVEGAQGPAAEFGRQLNEDLDKIQQNFEETGQNQRAFISNVNTLNSKFNTTVRTTQQLKEELSKLKIDPDAAAINFDQINAQSQKLDQTLTALFESGNQEAQRFALHLDNKVAKAMQSASGNTDIMRKELKKANAEAAEFIRTLPGLSEELKKAADTPPIIDEKKIQTAEIEAKAKKLEDTLKRLLDSTSQQAKNVGAQFSQLGSAIVDAYSKGNISADEAIRLLGKLQRTASQTGQAFVDDWRDVEGGANRAQVSIWRVGTALDRMGVRGAGSIAHIIDAFKALPLPILGVLAAVAGVTIAVKKLIEVVVDLSKKAAEAFLEFTKGAVEASKSMETLDQQLATILGHSEELGKMMRQFLLERSFQFGADLTEDFARLLVPLTSSTEQIERFAEAAAAISATLPGVDFDEMVRLIAEMARGRFRGATLGMTAGEVERIKAIQEEFGAIEGTLIGLQEYMDRRGIDFSNIEDSLRVAEGRFKVFIKEVNLAFGDPVTDELGKQLQRLAEFIDDNRDEILGFFEFLGERVSEVVERIGDFTIDFLEEIKPGDVREFKESIDDLTDSVISLIDALDQSVEGSDLLKVLELINTALGNFVGNIADIITLFQERGAGAILELPFIFGFNMGQKLREGLQEGLGDTDDLMLADEARFLDRAPIREPTDQEIQNWREQADALLEYNSALSELEEIAPEAAAAQKDINDAIREAGEDRRRKEMELQTEFTRRELQQEIDFSRQREDIHAKFGQRINEINIDFLTDLGNLDIDSARKREDILTDFNRKVEDLEQDSVDKKIDIEKKFRDRLKEIRARFDFDAQEAIRKNDAVALLQIRRREQFELQQAKDRKDQDIDQANDQEARKTRDLNVWLKRQEDDARLAEDRKLEDLIIADREKRAELGRQYKFELEQQQIAEQRKRDDLGQWRAWELEDIDTWWNEYLADLPSRFEDEYKIIEQAKQAQLRMALAYQRAIRNALIVRLPPAGSFVSGGAIPGLNPFQELPQFGTGVRVRDVWPTPLTPGGRQFGGFQTPGSRATLVGERRPEPFYPTQAGVIAPHVPLMLSTGVGAGGANVDMSRNVNADISTLDPSQISPIQQTIIRSIFMDQLLALGHGL